MKNPEAITIDLLSDTTFSRGESTPGAVDVEIEHDDLGLPRLGGKTLRGLLRDTWLSMQNHFPALQSAALRIYGPVGDMEEVSILRLGDAQLDPSVREWVAWAEKREQRPIAPTAILEALTDVRSQTSEERSTGAPAETTLRAVRVTLRGLQLAAPLNWLHPPTSADIQCLALSVLGTRHAGLARNRGRGFLQLALDGDVKHTGILARGASQ